MTANRHETPAPPSRRATAKAFLFAFGPLLLLAALGLIGAREASIDTRAAMSSSGADWATHAFAGDRNSTATTSASAIDAGARKARSSR